MTKKGKKKPKIVEYESDTEMAEVVPMTRVEIIYEDTKVVTRAETKFKWSQLFHMMVEKKVLEAGLEELVLYENILRSGIIKVATRPKTLPCEKFIGWILPKIDTTGMIINAEENKGVEYFAPAFISIAYSLLEKENSVTT